MAQAQTRLSLRICPSRRSPPSSTTCSPNEACAPRRPQSRPMMPPNRLLIFRALSNHRKAEL
jgi:hypothetical protein